MVFTITILLVLNVSGVAPRSYNKTQVQLPQPNNRSQVSGNDASFDLMETKTKALKSLYLLVLLPYPDLKGGLQPSWTGGPSVLPAIEMAVEDVNRRSGILDGYSLELINGDGGCNIVAKTSTSLVENIFYLEGKEPVGIIGPGCSASTLHMAHITGKDDIALISAHGASTPQLEEEREKYPYVFGGFSSLKSYAKAITGFVRQRQWTKLAVLYDGLRVFHTTAFTEINQAVTNLTDTKIEFSSAIYSNFIPIEQIKDQYLKVIIIMAGPALVRQTLCLAYSTGLTFPTHQFLIFERHLNELVGGSVTVTHLGKTYTCSNETMLKTMEGHLLTEYRVSPQDWSSPDTVNGTSYNDFASEYERRIRLKQEDEGYKYRSTVKKSIWGAMWYDLVWMMATALDKAGIDLEKYGVGMKEKTNEIYRRFMEVNFDGMSGKISFSQSSTFVQRNVDVHQINGTDLVHVAAINGSQVEDQFDGEYTSSEYPTKRSHMHIAATVVVLFLISVVTLALLVTHLLTVKYRHRTAVKGSSPRLQHLAYVGCYLLIVATVSTTIPKAFNISDAVYVTFCHVMYTSFSCGYTLIIGTVCAKTWRLYRIFCHFQKPGKLLADHFLFIVILLLALVDLLVNVVWVSVDRYNLNRTSHFETLEGGEGVVVVIETECTSRIRVVWTSIIVSYNVCILIVAVWLAILTRKVHLPQFQTKTVVILAYVLSFLCGLGIPLTLVLEKHYVWIVMFLPTVLFCLLLLFLPPLLPAITKKRYSRRVHAQASRPSIMTLFSSYTP